MSSTSRLYRHSLFGAFILISLACMLMINPSPAAALSIKIVSANISATKVRDGQRFTLNYQVNSSDTKTVMLGCTLHGPTGGIIEDDTNEYPENFVTLSVGTYWYSREFFLNVPPNAPTGNYSVEFGVDWDTSGFTSITKPNALQILAPISVRIPILLYHKVGPISYSEYWVTDDSFAAQIKVLHDYGYTPVSLSDVMNCRAGVSSLPPKPVVITFDDAYENMLTDAYPILQRAGIKTFACFVPTGLVGGNNSWDPGDDNPVIPHLTWDEIKSLQQTGVVDFESHTVTHPDLHAVSLAQLNSELSVSASTLSDQLGYRPLFIAYPYGMYFGREKNAARNADYFAAVDSGDGVEMTCKDKWAIQRVYIDSNTSVTYDPAHPSNFFLKKIGESFTVPAVRMTSFQALSGVSAASVASASFRPGRLVTFRAALSVDGSNAFITAGLRVSTDPDGRNIVYDSSLVGENVAIEPAVGVGQPEWVWKIPRTAVPVTYYASVTYVVQDIHQAVEFGRGATPWQPLFKVSK